MKRRLAAAATSLVLIMAVALAARVAYAWDSIRSMPPNLVGLVPFANETGNIAFSLAHGDGFSSPFLAQSGPTAWLTPVYPGLVAGIFKISGIRTAASFYGVLTLNVLCSVAACLPIFWIGRRVGGGIATGALAAWMWALLPTAIIIPYQWVWDTSLAALLVALITAATLSPAATWGIFDWCGYGLLWGFALMTNPSLAAALPFLFLWAARSNRTEGGVAAEQAARWRHAGIALGIAVLCCVPWTVRNYRAFHTWVPLRSTLPLQLWLGNNELYDPNFQGPVLANAARDDIRSYVRLGEVAFMRSKGEEAHTFIAAHPALYADLTWRRMVAFWFGMEHPWAGFWAAESQVVRLVVAVSALLFVLMLGGVVALARRRVPEGLVLAAWVVAYPLVFYLTRTLLRYRNVIEPIIVVLAAAAITSLWRRNANESVAAEL